MQEVQEVVSKVIEILDKFDNAIDLALIVCMTLLSRSVKRSAKCIASSPADVPATPKSVKATKAGFSDEFKKGLELYYSDKKIEDMTEDEKALFERVQRFLEV